MSPLTFDEAQERGHPIWAEVDLEAIRHNIRTLDAVAPGAQVMGVVKGFAYGHGNPASAQAMLEGGATRLGVARVAEAIHLRDAGITAPIQVFSEPPPRSAGAFVEHDLIATVYTEAFADAVSEAAAERGARAKVHVKLDTGMHRVGLQEDELHGVMKKLAALPGIELEGVWSHLAVADTPDHPFTHKQLELFNRLVAEVEASGVSIPIKHIANSAATLAFPETHLDMVRCGIAAYGLWPGAALVGSADLRPALELKARVSMVKTVAAGDALSYGLRYQLGAPGRVVTIAGGYADGYDRRLSGEADILLNGRRHRVSGTVCMDQFMVDLHDDEATAGDVATLIGREGSEIISAEELAVIIGTINYEVTTRIPSRVPRVYLNERSGS
jgi:alanine racemase